MPRQLRRQLPRQRRLADAAHPLQRRHRHRPARRQLLFQLGQVSRPPREVRRRRRRRGRQRRQRRSVIVAGYVGLLVNLLVALIEDWHTIPFG